MNAVLLAIGRPVGIAGALLCAAAVALRVSGLYVVWGFGLGTLLVVGIAAMTGACFCLLWVLVDRSKERP
jgi:hypothetical protein